MPILQVEHGVRDYDVWKKAFDSDPLGREQGGVRRYRIFRPADDPSYVVVNLEFDSPSEADAFRGKIDELWSRAADDLGLVHPKARLLDVVESEEY